MKYSEGFIALTTVLILSAIFLSISLGVASSAIRVTRGDISFLKHNQAEMLADACAEYALMELERTLDYMGDDSILIDGIPCGIDEVTIDEDGARVLVTEGSVDGYVSQTRVVISSVSPNMVISSWERGIDF